MNWLTNFVRPKIQQLVQRTEVPDNLWHKCPECEQMIFHRDLEKNRRVCNHCGHHMRLDAIQRLEVLFDDGKYEREILPKPPVDPLKFKDTRRYTDRIKDAHTKSGEDEAIIVATGKIGGVTTVAAVLNFSYMGGSMGIGVGEGFVAAARKAVKLKAPFLAVPSSGGARMQEGILSLMQMARTTVAVSEVKEAGLPYIVLLADPTTGGVSASFAMLGDIALAEPGAIIGFAGARVIEQTIRETLPEGFQRSEYLLEHGMLDMVVPRDELNQRIGRVLRILTSSRPAKTPVPDAGDDTDFMTADTPVAKPATPIIEDKSDKPKK
ncbi:acetyl-CoA carboxylase carboxyltransferase subunit beta [Alphaproteobacteria bacterium HT1-32]|nr:acetyl-CoA carboxylase carboxyltransferase subunit beta [Alphaproteobacteria bacterium HT1-32]|tara:strand:- start:9001 stop:9969 length:969 start_codon:yes stop_codon:yes gene_type:complete